MTTIHGWAVTVLDGDGNEILSIDAAHEISVTREVQSWNNEFDLTNIRTEYSYSEIKVVALMPEDQETRWTEYVSRVTGNLYCTIHIYTNDGNSSTFNRAILISVSWSNFIDRNVMHIEASWRCHMGQTFARSPRELRKKETEQILDWHLYGF